MSENNNQVVTTAPVENEFPNKWAQIYTTVANFFGFSTKYRKGSKARKKLVVDIVVFTVLLLGSFIMLYPFWWMLIGSLTVDDYALNGLLIIPGLNGDGFRWIAEVEGKGLLAHYEAFFSATENAIKVTVWRVIGNSLLYSLVPVTVGVITSTMAAFSFAKIEWIGRNAVFYYLLAAIMVPGPSIMSIQYCMYNAWGWTNGPLTQVIPGLFGSIMTAFFVRQFLFGLPTSIIEAAKIDGAGYARIFIQFILPLAFPAMMAQFILSFMGAWNNYIGIKLFVDDQQWMNIAYLVEKVSAGASTTQAKTVLNIVGSVLCVIPVLVLFAAFQKQIIGSLMLTGSKE